MSVLVPTAERLFRTPTKVLVGNHIFHNHYKSCSYMPCHAATDVPVQFRQFLCKKKTSTAANYSYIRFILY